MNLLYNEEVLLSLAVLKMLWIIQICVKYWIWINSLKYSGYYIMTFWNICLNISHNIHLCVFITIFETNIGLFHKHY
jgi:hypothetical protein